MFMCLKNIYFLVASYHIIEYPNYEVLESRPQNFTSFLQDNEATEADQNLPQNVTYQASSPDEVALVQWSEDVGLTLVDRDLSSMKLKTPNGEVLSYSILQIFPFTSETKRMGIILQVILKMYVEVVQWEDFQSTDLVRFERQQFLKQLQVLKLTKTWNLEVLIKIAEERCLKTQGYERILKNIAALIQF